MSKRRRRPSLGVCAFIPCPELVSHPGASYCEAHEPEPWRDRDLRRAGEKKLSQAAREARRSRIFKAHKGRCHVCGLSGADELDHVRPIEEGGADSDSNLAPIHASPCHREKTQAEAQRARARKQASK